MGVLTAGLVVAGVGAAAAVATTAMNNSARDKAKTNSGPTDDYLNSLQTNMDSLRQQYEGTLNGTGGPSQAQQQLTAATNQNVNSLAGQVAGMRGVNPNVAARAVAENAATSNQTAANQSSILRANEILNAQQGLAGLSNNANAQRLQKDTINANLTTGTASSNASIIGGAINGGATALAAAMSDGGKVEGKPEVEGDSKKNDKVHTMLSPGEIVIPRSAAKDPAKAKAFIDEVLGKSKDSSEDSEEDDGDFSKVAKALAKMEKRLAKLEK